MPVFKVKVTVEAIVESEDLRSARFDGFDALRDELGNLGGFDVTVTALTSSDHLPAGWTKDSLIYHEGTEDRTVEEALAGRIEKEV